ncbi:uncharacterized protein N7500_009457 [Penicillium coprophilum]|uniref:uncharacterized protein n=1 Tax=Penicillium coprophilum TaxID=36646 RepID=UPI00238E3A3E|nr:uncharacterized protein N7500_009457 [Penicillium coprophilum]KAJ5154018.1 hypothetical protein N7500_009457 [Penicillium coprophilum]
MTVGVPGKYRVVTDYKDDQGDFRGVMQHTGATTGGAYTACTRVTSPKPETGKDKGDKKGNNKERSVQATEAEIAEEYTSHSVNDLATRAKKKKIGSATCEGTTLSKNDVANAFKEGGDRRVGGYPHKFGNKSAGAQVFEGVTKDLREYPILKGGTWTGGPPGKYRLVADYKNNFVGVMVDKPGAAFTRCTVNAD